MSPKKPTSRTIRRAVERGQVYAMLDLVMNEATDSSRALRDSLDRFVFDSRLDQRRRDERVRDSH